MARKFNETYRWIWDPGFTAPECFIDANNGDESSDLFAIVTSWLSAILPEANFTTIQEKDEWFSYINQFTVPISDIIGMELQQLLQTTLAPQPNRSYRSSDAFFNDLSSCLFFINRTVTDIDLINHPKFNYPIVGWADHLTTSIKVPVQLEMTISPTLPIWIQCQHFSTIKSTVCWATP